MLVFVISASLILALLITFLNGMNDAADAVSCLITTKVLTPLKAVAWAAFWGFMAYFIFDSHVAETMSRGLVEAHLPRNSSLVTENTVVRAAEMRDENGNIGVRALLSHYSFSPKRLSASAAALCSASLLE